MDNNFPAITESSKFELLRNFIHNFDAYTSCLTVPTNLKNPTGDSFSQIVCPPYRYYILFFRLTLFLCCLNILRFSVYNCVHILTFCITRCQHFVQKAVMGNIWKPGKTAKQSNNVLWVMFNFLYILPSFVQPLH